VEGQNIIIKKVKKGGHGGHHGGSWKVAYADFVTAMMAFFLLLWLITMVAPEKRARVSSYFKHFSIFDKSGTTMLDFTNPESKFHVIESEKPPEKVDDLTEPPPVQAPPETSQKSENEFVDKLRKEVESKLFDVKDQIMLDVFEGGVRIEIVDKDGNPMFPLGSTEMTPQAKKILQVITENLRDNRSRIAIEGHSDARSTASSRYSNWELSTERASSARKEMERDGLDPGRLIRVAGYASTEPIIKENPLDPRNRRISILLFYTYGTAAGAARSTGAGASPVNATAVGNGNKTSTVESTQPVQKTPDGYAKPPVDAVREYLFKR
jgi:chemotaxis protein MotB